jgi:hypothetical protein
MNIEETAIVYEAFTTHGFSPGRLLSWSKSTYRFAYPDNDVYFNANIFTQHGKIWYGDLDLTLDEKKLKKVAREIKEDLYILKEMDGRFGGESEPIEKIKQKAVKVIFCEN